MQLDIKNVADKADMIINGYAFTQENKYIRVLNLNQLNHAAVIYNDKIVETNMDDIENQIVLDYYLNNKQLNKIAARWPAKAVAQFYFY